ncbi:MULTISPECIES: NAD-binding protein [unclassified Rhodococcus (in: high G+C Gram-positive bacteria)]|uniref:NAD-binding protein n=1 Tax=unclassified Rhodococcus (in: high G+C Gram-positive bacteria) TaxID=192944 RepID=UPI001F60555C|nr:NAD-binding protein [Rhodococcus sp. KB6]
MRAVVGYGTKGSPPSTRLLAAGLLPSDVVVADTDPAVLEVASRQGLVTVHGSATRLDLLQLAGAGHTASMIVATYLARRYRMSTIECPSTRSEGAHRRCSPWIGEHASSASICCRHGGRHRGDRWPTPGHRHPLLLCGGSDRRHPDPPRRVRCRGTHC